MNDIELLLLEIEPFKEKSGPWPDFMTILNM